MTMEDQEFAKYKIGLIERINQYFDAHNKIASKYGEREHLFDIHFDHERESFLNYAKKNVATIDQLLIHQVDDLLQEINKPREKIYPSTLGTAEGMELLKIKLLLKKINLIVTDWVENDGLLYENGIELGEMKEAKEIKEARQDVKLLDSLIDQLMAVSGNLTTPELLQDLQNTKLRHAVTDRIIERSRLKSDNLKHITLSTLLTAGSSENMLVKWLKTPTSHGITRGLSRLWGGSTSSFKKLTKAMSEEKNPSSSLLSNKK